MSRRAPVIPQYPAEVGEYVWTAYGSFGLQLARVARVSDRGRVYGYRFSKKRRRWTRSAVDVTGQIVRVAYFAEVQQIGADQEAPKP